MKLVPYIFLTLICFIYLIFMAIIYMKFEKKRVKKEENKINTLEKKLEEVLVSQFMNVISGKEVDKGSLEYTNKILRSSSGKVAFNNVLFKLNKERKFSAYTSKLMKNYETFVLQEIYKYNKKDDIKKAYLLYSLGEYKLCNEEIKKLLIKELIRDSLYVRYNALNSISNIGDKETIIEALRYISKNNIYVNEKMFLEVLDKSKNDLDISKSIMKNLSEFNTYVQSIIINSFSKNKYALCGEELLNKLSLEKDREVRISIIKYFGCVKIEKAKEELISLLESKWWEERALAAKSLNLYYSDEVEENLKKSIKDSNWHVRLNSALTIIENNCSEKLIEEILLDYDKYANEILLYVLKDKSRDLYEKFSEEKNRSMALTC